MDGVTTSIIMSWVVCIRTSGELDYLYQFLCEKFLAKEGSQGRVPKRVGIRSLFVIWLLTLDFCIVHWILHNAGGQSFVPVCQIEGWPGVIHHLPIIHQSYTLEEGTVLASPLTCSRVRCWHLEETFTNSPQKMSWSTSFSLAPFEHAQL